MPGSGALEQGLHLTGSYVRTDVRTITPKPGQTWEAFSREVVRLIVDGQYPRTVEYPEGGVPEVIRLAQQGDVVTLPVYVRAVVHDVPYFNGITKVAESSAA